MAPLPLGQLAVQAGLLQPSEVDQLLARQGYERGRGRFRRLGQLMVEAKACAADRVRILLAQQGVRLVRCELCATRYNAVAWAGRAGCARCGRGLREVTSDEPLAVEDTLCDPHPRAQAVLAGWRRRSDARLGPYLVLGEIGRGAMGVVYKAWDTVHERVVALKLLLQPDSALYEDTSRFRREAQALADLRHPNIVRAHALEDAEGLLYMVMEFVPGVSFTTLLGARAIGVREQVGIVAGVARALAHSHAAGIVHRDVKPDNIVVDRSLHGYLVDFGLLKSEAESMSLTLEGHVVGTLGFMAPEYVAQGVDAVDPLCDVFGLGVVLYQGLSGGYLPFSAGDEQAMVRRILSDSPTPLADRAPNVPTRLQQVVMQAIERDRSRRCPSAQELAGQLEALLPTL